MIVVTIWHAAYGLIAMNRSDIVIHIDEDLDDNAIHALERELAEESGVFSACVNDRARHLMLVDFDPQDVHAADLLHRVQGRGLHAELIGL